MSTQEAVADLLKSIQAHKDALKAATKENEVLPARSQELGVLCCFRHISPILVLNIDVNLHISPWHGDFMLRPVDHNSQSLAAEMKAVLASRAETARIISEMQEVCPDVYPRLEL